MKKINLIYIAPMGFSGSTILDLTLNQHKKIQSVGEVIFFDRWVTENLLCSCTNPILECSFWTQILAELPKGFRLAGETGKAETLFGIPDESNTAQKKYAERSYTLLKQVQKKAASEYVLDSSKDVGRLERLALYPLFNLKVIHLVRDGKDVVQSSFKEKKRPSFQAKRNTKSRSALKTSLRWKIVNHRLEEIVQLNNLDSIFVRYEDFIEQPELETTRILDFLGLNSIKITRDIDNTDIHNISGSRWRFENDIRIKNKTKTNTDINIIDNLVFELIAGRSYTKYEYRK